MSEIQTEQAFYEPEQIWGFEVGEEVLYQISKRRREKIKSIVLFLFFMFDN